MKSHTVALWACWNTFFPYKQRALYTRYTLTSAEISIIPEFEEKLDLLNVRPSFNITKKVITNTQTGSDIIFSGIKTSSGNQTAKLKSIPGLNVFIIDEAEEFDSADGRAERDFDTINESIRTQGIPNLVIFILNPPTTTHWIWPRWFEGWTTYREIDGARIAMTTHPDVFHIHTTYLDNLKNLSASFLDEADKLKQYNRDKYDHRLLGAWREQAEGVIYTNWREGEFDDSLPYCYGLDDGYTDPLALVRVAVDTTHRKIYVEETLYNSGLSTNQVKNIIGIIKRPQDLIEADSENPRLIEDLSEKYNVSPTYKYAGSVIDGIRRIQDYEIIVTPESHNVKKELNNYVWNDKKAEIPVDDYNHALDAMRYAFQRLAPGSDVLGSG